VALLEALCVCCFVLFPDIGESMYGLGVSSGQVKGSRTHDSESPAWNLNLSPWDNMGLLDPHPPPSPRPWLQRAPPLPLRTDPASNAVDNQGPALAAPCLGRSNVRSDSLVMCNPDSNWKPIWTTKDRFTWYGRSRSGRDLRMDSPSLSPLH